MNNGLSILGKILCVLISIACIGFIVYMNLNDRVKVQQTAQEVEAINEDTREAEKEIAQLEAEEKAAEIEEKKENDSFYQKLRDGFDVNILVVGDTTANGYGASSDTATWFSVLKSYLEAQYPVGVNLDNMAILDSGAYASYARVKSMADEKEYDFAIICTGASDTEDTLPVYYEALLRAIQNKYRKCSLFTVQEYMEGDSNARNMAIRSLSNSYNAATADLYSEVTADSAQYLQEGGYLNDAGHTLYANRIFSVIKEAVKNNTEYKKGPDATVYRETERFDQFLYVPADKFTRNGAQYALDTSFKGIVAFDFDVLPGENTMNVYVDRVKVSSYIVTNTISIPVEHIELVQGELSPNRRIGVIFSSDEAANSFRGMYVNTV